MRRSIILAILALTANCTPMKNTATTEASNTPAAVPGQYEPAPVVTPIGFGMPPDLRDKICGDAQDRNGNYATLTKSVSTFCR